MYLSVSDIVVQGFWYSLFMMLLQFIEALWAFVYAQLTYRFHHSIGAKCCNTWIIFFFNHSAVDLLLFGIIVMLRDPFLSKV